MRDTQKYWFPRRQFMNGFTMMEIMITLVILGVIAALAIPAYFATVEQGRSNEARVNLAIIRMGEKIYYTQNANTYWLPGTNPAVDCAVGAQCINRTLNVDITTDNYDITSINNTGGLTIVARRNARNGGAGAPANLRCFSMDVNGVITAC